MKKNLGIILFLMMAVILFGNSNYQDVVYLKDGTVIKGMITEEVVGDYLKIETVDQNIFVLKMKTIKKIKKERLKNDSFNSRESSRLDEEIKSSFKAREKFGIDNRENILDDAGNDSYIDYPKKDGYLGLSVGISMPNLSFSDNCHATTGFQFNINWGYLFMNNIGIASTAFTASNGFEGETSQWEYFAILAGPMVTVPIADMFEWDLRAMCGYVGATPPEVQVDAYDGHSYDVFYNSFNSAFGLSFGTVFRWNFSNSFSFFGNIDYFQTNDEFSKEYRNSYSYESIETITFGVGLAYRIK